MASIAVIDDHPIVLEGIERLLAGAGHAIVARAADPRRFLREFDPRGLDLAVVDLNMPGMSGIELAAALGDLAPQARVVILTSNISSLDVSAAIRAGVDGLVLKETALGQLVRCVDAVLRGERWYDPEVTQRILAHQDDRPAATEHLSDREVEIVDLVVAGHRNKEIARLLSITEGTVKTHLHNIYAKLGVASRTQLAYMARRGG